MAAQRGVERGYEEAYFDAYSEPPTPWRMELGRPGCVYVCVLAQKRMKQKLKLQEYSLGYWLC